MANELRQLIDTANAPIFGIDFHGNVNEWNDKTAEITGYSKKEAMGVPLVNTFIVKNLRESVLRVMDHALQGNETSNYELEFRTKVRLKNRFYFSIMRLSFFLTSILLFKIVPRNSPFASECNNSSRRGQ